MTWPQYRRLLNRAGYRRDKADSSGAMWTHKHTGRSIYPHEFKEQPDGTRRTNWQYWAAHDMTPPPF
ncbi:MAG: hypothetical protein AMJ53_02885 [Gammaproteobacteria bacterium SG8_11]|nr:MAG: hypothetical protein AMJ53_02885 [Gammaproteobacteria bacterium SG8_11]